MVRPQRLARTEARERNQRSAQRGIGVPLAEELQHQRDHHVVGPGRRLRACPFEQLLDLATTKARAVQQLQGLGGRRIDEQRVLVARPRLACLPRLRRQAGQLLAVEPLLRAVRRGLVRRRFIRGGDRSGPPPDRRGEPSAETPEPVRPKADHPDQRDHHEKPERASRRLARRLRCDAISSLARSLSRACQCYPAAGVCDLTYSM